MRHLADALSASGFPVLRFDYHGMGNSAGTEKDGNRLTAWQDSIRSAIDTLKNTYGCAEVGLIGFRFGATLAALIASEIEVANLVLWAPLVQGKHYTRQMKVLQLTGDNPSYHSEGSIEAVGYLLTQQTIAEMNRVNLIENLPRTSRILIAARDDMPDDFSLRDAWMKQGRSVAYRKFSGVAEMLVEAHNTRVPVENIAQIVQWVREGLPSSRIDNESPSRLLKKSAIMRINDCTKNDETPSKNIEEHILEFGTQQPLFGIFSHPQHDFASKRPVVLLLNTGSVHHIGTCRLYVRLARNLALAGFSSLRMDFIGLGDSFMDDFNNENAPYTLTATEDIAAAIQAMKQHYGSESFVLAGLCSGAHASFHGVLDLSNEPVVECVLINPMPFYWKPGMSVDRTPEQESRHWNWYLRSIGQRSRWVKLLRGDVNLKKMFFVLLQYARTVLVSRIKTVSKGFSRNKNDDLAADINKIIQANRQITFVFSKGDPGYNLLMASAKKTIKQKLAEKKLSIEFIENTNHNFTTLAKQREVIERLIQHLVKRYC
ncbi:MAG: alpha/beta fold hydrolase [Nitrospirota bacterium]